MTRWLVSLTGAAADLSRLVEWPDGEDWQILRHDKQGVVLCSPRFDAVDDYEIVGSLAKALILHINRSARHQASNFQGVSRGNIVEQRQDRDHVIVTVGLAVETDIAASVSWVKVAHNGTIIESSESRAMEERASGFHRLVTLQEAHPDLADALHYLDDECNMSGLYKVGEAILRAVGMQNRRKKWKPLVDLGWTSDDELWRFTRSTHMERHHRPNVPQNLMTVREAEAYVRGLLSKLIVHLDTTTP